MDWFGKRMSDAEYHHRRQKCLYVVVGIFALILWSGSMLTRAVYRERSQPATGVVTSVQRMWSGWYAKYDYIVEGGLRQHGGGPVRHEVRVGEPIALRLGIGNRHNRPADMPPPRGGWGWLGSAVVLFALAAREWRRQREVMAAEKMGGGEEDLRLRI